MTPAKPSLTEARRAELRKECDVPHGHRANLSGPEVLAILDALEHTEAELMAAYEAWIQRAKALLFDCGYAVDSESLRDEIILLVEQGGGYDPHTETPTSQMYWHWEDRR